VHTSFDTDVVYSRLMPVTQMRLKPVLQSFFESSSVEERMLLRFWITCGSSRMISTGHPDNPYRHVFVPLAMAALGSGKRLAGNYALLHSIYAWAASNMAQLQDQQNSENTRVQASSHYQLSLAYLRESLDVGDVEQQGATLAAIVLITTMDIVNGESYKWRIHLQGGRVWLKSVSTTWQSIPDNQIIYQVFRGLEVFGYSHDKLLIHPNDWSASEQELDESETLEEPFTSLANDPDGDAYCLDRYFGITKPVLDIIWAIKRISKRGSGPTLVEISDIEEQLMKANPSILRFACPTESIERLTRHHACSFYFACVTAFKRSLLHCHPSDVQYLVEQSLFHLEATMAAEIKMELTVTGLLWPLFVTSAEAADQLLRERCLRVFEFRKTQGVLSVAQTEDVVLEIWRRRDASLNPEYVHRHEVMEDLGADILLA
jgi:arginine metabolism regulation protein II